jgi:hypothetical protein
MELKNFIIEILNSLWKISIGLWRNYIRKKNRRSHDAIVCLESLIIELSLEKVEALPSLW